MTDNVTVTLAAVKLLKVFCLLIMMLMLMSTLILFNVSCCGEEKAECAFCQLTIACCAVRPAHFHVIFVSLNSLLLRFTEDTFDPEQSATIGYTHTDVHKHKDLLEDTGNLIRSYNALVFPLFLSWLIRCGFQSEDTRNRWEQSKARHMGKTAVIKLL